MSTFVKTDASFRQGARTLPREHYVSPELFDAEVERIFRRSWVCVGRADEIARPGDYALVSFLGDSIVVVRDYDDRVRAFHNVCRHRGARLCEAGRGTFAKTIQCPYHAWTYALDGRLVGAPQMDGADGFDRADFPLLSIAAGVWDGFIFLNLAEDPEPLERWLRPLIGRFDRFNLSSLRSARRIDYDVNANWKLIVQNYSECLHCPVIHPELSERSPYTSGENDLVEGPFLGGFMTLTQSGGSMTMSREPCARFVGDLPPEDHDRIYYYSIFPNLLLSLHPDYVMFHTLWPEGPARTKITCEWLFHPDADESPDFDPDDASDFWDLTNRQDWDICERTQRGVASSAYVPGPYSPRESIPAAWDAEYLRWMADVGD